MERRLVSTKLIMYLRWRYYRAASKWESADIVEVVSQSVLKRLWR